MQPETKKTDFGPMQIGGENQTPYAKQKHTPEGPAEEFINEYDSKVEDLPSEKKQTTSTSPGENRNKSAPDSNRARN